jgi:photosystem II stability/assembly factor-like uncharacterized protein
MAKKKKQQIYLLVGTKKGAFILTSDLQRKRWNINGPLLKGAEVNDFAMDVREEPKLFACVNSYWWGANIRMSTDMGKTWIESKSGIQFDEKSGNKVNRLWSIMPAGKNEPGKIYLGVDPGAFFTTQDSGITWNEVKSLTSHATRSKWAAGAGGLMVHSICPDPDNPKKIFLGISAAGTFATEDGGKTWEPRNKGVRADFLPEKFPAVGQCVHHLEMHPAKPRVLYQQNHCGVYRSDNEGKEWTDISDGLPSRFGFPIQIHPHDPDTIYVIPEEGGEFRAAVKGNFSVYRSRNRGNSWKKLGKGLPTKNAFLHVHRQCMKMDQCEQAGLYVATSSGQIFFSGNDGTSWKTIADYLPMIYSINTVVF